MNTNADELPNGEADPTDSSSADVVPDDASAVAPLLVPGSSTPLGIIAPPSPDPPKPDADTTDDYLDRG